MEHIPTISDSAHPRPRLEGASSDDLARMAYASVGELPFLEMNDGNRLGYHIYLFLSGQIATVADAIYEAKARTALHPSELERIIVGRLGASGVAFA